jgi:hypothetical protein
MSRRDRRRKRAISAIAQRRLPLYAPAHPREEEARGEPYDAADDFSRSLDACYAVIRARIAAGGEGWEPR